MELSAWWHLIWLIERIHFFFNLSKTDLPFRFCKIGLRNTLFVFGRNTLFVFGRKIVVCSLFVLFCLFVATLSDFGLLF